MPAGLDGLVLCRRIAQNMAVTHTRVVVITSDPADEMRAIQAGAHAYFCKPFSPLDLLRTIDRLVETRLADAPDAPGR
jgi:CheY-like chemotaxis protein